MKNFFRKILLLIFLLLLNNILYSQWKILTTREDLYSIQFVTNNIGYVSGNSGLLLKTTNGGQSWKYQTNIDDYLLKSCFFLNTTTGFVCAYGQTHTGGIFETTDSGNSWVMKYSNDLILNSIHFPDSLTGFAVGELGRIYKTTNGGNNWALINTINNIELTSIFMTSRNSGTVVGGYGYNRRICRTDDGGNSWQTVIADSGQFLNQVYFVNSMKGWILDDPGSVWRTTNSGFNWTKITHNIYGNFHSLYFTDTINGWLTGTSAIYKTANGGLTWTPQLSSNYDNPFWFLDIKFYDNLHGVTVGSFGIKYITSNGGVNWTECSNTIDGSIRSVFFVNNLSGWVVTSTGIIASSIDGGITWNSQTNLGSSLNCIIFTDNNIGWVAANGGKIFKTTNGGNNWSTLDIGTSSKLNCVRFINSLTGWVFGDSGFVAKSTNSGDNWTIQTSGTQKNILMGVFTGANNGQFVGDNVISKTTDGGVNWDSQIDNINKYTAIRFYNSNTGWLTCYRLVYAFPFGYSIRKILKTINNGNSWDTVYSQQNSSVNFFNDLCFTDSSNVWAVSNNLGNVLRTQNSGASWYLETQPFVRRLNSVFAISTNRVWAVGDTGTVLGTYNSEPIGINTTGYNLPTEFKLSQNYPNPFNPRTKLNFSVPIFSKILLRVFDILGQEVGVLVDEFKQPGEYEINFNGENLSSGIYFYRLETESFSETKKMIILK